MDVLHQVEVMIAETIKKNQESERGLRLQPEEEKERQTDACIADVAARLELELTVSELSTYAASAKYSWLFFQHHFQQLIRQRNATFDACMLAKSGAEGDANQAMEVLKRLYDDDKTLISKAVRYGAAMTNKEKAAKGGNKRSEKMLEVRNFAIQKFDAQQWKSARQASRQLFPLVQVEAKRHNWTMSDQQGPETLYKWFLSHKKVPC